MKRLSLFALGLILPAFLPLSSSAQSEGDHADCGGTQSCVLESGRSYQALVPDGWNGKDKLPVLIHFHGWGRTGTNVLNNRKIGGAAKEAGMVLLAPNGQGKSWSFWNTPSRDVPFVAAMIDDAVKRFAVDRERIYVSGYSYGAAMAWRLACERGADFAGFLTIAGTLWNLEELEDCTSPITLRHVHGLRDTVMDLPVGENGNPLYAVYPWVSLAGCQSKPDESGEIGEFKQSVWTDCATKHTVELELHKGGHLIPKDWLKRQLDRIQKSYAGS